MKKSYKLILLVIVVAGIILFMSPESFKHYYKDVQVYENGNKVSKIDIKLDGKVYKGRFIWQGLKFSEELHGNITIGDKNYFLSPVDLYEFPDLDGNYTDNGIYESLLSSNPEDIINDKYLTFYITHDKSKLYIISDSEEFIYPYNSDEDYQKVKDIMYR